MLIPNSTTLTYLKSNISEITRLDKGIKEAADPKFKGASTYLIREISARINSLSAKVVKCNISATTDGMADYSIPLLFSQELIKMLSPVFDLCYCRNPVASHHLPDSEQFFAQFLDE